VPDGYTIDESRAEKVAAVERYLTALDGALVAFSGGVDSSLLLALSVRALGTHRVLAVTARGPLEAVDDSDSAAEVAREIGVSQLFVEFDPLSLPEFPANTPDRCYFCRKKLFEMLEQIRAERGLESILEGTIADDAGDYRPGGRAALEAGAKRPLAEAGLSKADVRMAARELGLSTADKPASPCLASRFPYGETITVDALGMVAAAEALLRTRGFPVVRVRHHGTMARVEVPADRIHSLCAEPFRSELVNSLRNLGYAYVCLDLQGFRSGSLNEVLEK
jgi:pyridinium-3,5-biscarboxylic acid mononucleotide sulfurtransferase